MANDYRILDERDIKNFQAGNKLNVTEIGNKVTYEHIGSPPDRLPLQEQILKYGESFDITVPSVYDSTGHVKSEKTYSFIMPEKDDTSEFLTIDNFDADSPISVDKQNGNVTYSHNTISQTPINSNTTSLNYGQTFSFSALSGADSYGHANKKTTYTFQMPEKDDTSEFLTIDNFDADSPISVDKQNGNVTYSHNTISQTPINSNTTSLNYGQTFSFSALSGADSYGHANKKTTYTFQMPAAPSVPTVDTSKFPKTENFSADEPIIVTKDTNNNTVKYSHKSFDNTSPSSTKLSLNYGESVSFDAISTLDDYGHVSKKAEVNLTMPKVPSVKQCVVDNTWFEDSGDGLNLTKFYDTKGNLDLTTICFVTFFPGLGQKNTDGSVVFFTDIFTIPVPTFSATTLVRDYNVKALKVTTTDTGVESIGTVDETITIQLQTENSDRSYFHLTYPIGFVDRIEVVGF